MLKHIFILLTITLISLTPTYANTEVTEKEIIDSINIGTSGVKKLVKRVSIHKRFSEDKTLLHYAVELNNYDVVSFLVHKNILLSQKGGEFYGTALQEAIYYGYPRIANFLIEQDTPVNISDTNGNTALHLAAKNGDLDIIRTLLSYGADKHMLNNSGDIAYNLIPTLIWDNTDEIKALLSITPVSTKKTLPYSSLELDNNLETLPIQRKSNKVINNIDNKSSFKNSNFGINIKISNN